MKQLEPSTESLRLAALDEYDISAARNDRSFEDVVEMAADLLDVPVALISLVGRDAVMLLAAKGFPVGTCDRSQSFCTHAILGKEIMCVSDARRDPRFCDNPIVTGGPRLAFYAGAPLVTPGGHSIGALCVLDDRPRELSEDHRTWMTKLANLVVSNLELRRHVALVRELAEGRREELEDATRRADELERFASFAAHELSAPLNRIRRWASLARQDVDGGSAANEHRLQRIERDAQGLSEMVRELLSLVALPESGSDGGLCDVSRLLECAASDAIDAAQAKGVELRTSIPSALEARASTLAVRQIADNLLSNAIKYCHPSREPRYASVAAERRGERIVVTVRDNGLGVPKDAQSRMFEMFARFHRERASGTGLGLALVNRHVQACGGSIDVDSSDAGTTIRVSLPAAAEQRSAACF